MRVTLTTPPQGGRLGGTAVSPRQKQGVYGAGLYALRQAIQIFDDQGEQEQRYTIFADSASAIDRIASDNIGPGQRLAVGATGACGRVMSWGNSITIRWTPAHLGADGNDMAGLYARRAAESELYAVDWA